MRKKLIRVMVGTAFVTVAGFAVYHYLYQQASTRVKREIVKVADMMALSQQERAEVKRLIEAAHDGAFHETMDLTRRLGRKFDAQRYYELLFERVMDRAREEGKVALAAKIEGECKLITFNVEEY